MEIIEKKQAEFIADAVIQGCIVNLSVYQRGSLAVAIRNLRDPMRAAEARKRAKELLLRAVEYQNEVVDFRGKLYRQQHINNDLRWEIIRQTGRLLRNDVPSICPTWKREIIKRNRREREITVSSEEDSK